MIKKVRLIFGLFVLTKVRHGSRQCLIRMNTYSIMNLVKEKTLLFIHWSYRQVRRILQHLSQKLQQVLHKQMYSGTLLNHEPLYDLKSSV